MVRFVETTEELNDTNLSRSGTMIYVGISDDARNLWYNWDKNQRADIHFSKHSIKETDMRVKTASFTTNQQVDLTTGQYCVLITSPQFENFAGVILSEEYDEKTGLYTYQCQDWSRKHMGKTNMKIITSNLWNVLCYLISNGNVLLTHTQKDLDNWKDALSGLRPASEYNQVDWGSIVNFNPMTQVHRIMRRIGGIRVFILIPVRYRK